MVDIYVVWDPAKEIADVWETSQNYSTKEYTATKTVSGVKAHVVMHMLFTVPNYRWEIVSQHEFNNRVESLKNEWAKHNPEASIEAEIPIEWRAVEEV